MDDLRVALFATTINYLDRQVLGLLKPVLEQEFNWTEKDYSYIVMAFTATYALGLVVFGRFIDRIGTKLGYTISVTVWSIAAMLHAVVKSTLGFGIARGALGIGESGNFPAAVKTVAEWFPKRERALATGIFDSGANIGACVAPILVPWILGAYGWREAFIITGAIGFLWLIAWRIFMSIRINTRRYRRKNWRISVLMTKMVHPKGLPESAWLKQRRSNGYTCSGLHLPGRLLQANS